MHDGLSAFLMQEARSLVPMADAIGQLATLLGG
jgi:hypothetical protein